MTDSCFCLGVGTGGLENQNWYLSWNFPGGSNPLFRKGNSKDGKLILLSYYIQSATLLVPNHPSNFIIAGSSRPSSSNVMIFKNSPQFLVDNLPIQPGPKNNSHPPACCAFFAWRFFSASCQTRQKADQVLGLILSATCLNQSDEKQHAVVMQWLYGVTHYNLSHFLNLSLCSQMMMVLNHFEALSDYVHWTNKTQPGNK